MKRIAALSLALLLLASCRDSNSDPANGDPTNSGLGAPGTRTSRREDTPRTRLAAVKSHAIFATLAQRPECDANQRTVQAVFFETEFRLLERIEHIGEIQCNAKVTLLVDEASGMLKSVTECRSPNYVSISNTSDYAVEGNRLRIGKIGTIEVDVDGKTLLLTHDRDSSGIPTRLSPTDLRQVSESESSAVYANFCG